MELHNGPMITTFIFWKASLAYAEIRMAAVLEESLDLKCCGRPQLSKPNCAA